MRARLAVSLLYVIMGTMIGSWGARVPAIRARVAADETSWGLALPVLTLARIAVLAGQLKVLPDRCTPTDEAWKEYVHARIQKASGSTPPA